MYQAAATFFTFKFVLLSGDTSNTGYPKGSKALFDLLCRPGVFELNAIPEVQLLNAKIRLACVLLSTIELCRQKQDADPNLLDPKRWRDFVGSPEIVCDDVFFREVRTRVLEVRF